MKRAGTDVPSRYFHELATWSNINRMYERKVMNEVLQVRFESAQPELVDRLVRVLDEQRGHTIAMEVEEAKIALSDKKKFDMSFDWVEPGLSVAVGRKDLVTHTARLAANIAARITKCLQQAQLAAEDIDAVFLTGGSAQLAHVREAIIKMVPAARLIEGDKFGAVGKGLTIEAARRYGVNA
jgi:hypothetical chaperone protein